MRIEVWQERLGKINQAILDKKEADLNFKFENINIIEELKDELKQVLSKDEYKKWEDEGFNLNHLFQVEGNKGTGEYTVLDLFAGWGLENGVKALLAVKGIDVNIKDERNGSTPLHRAVGGGHIKVVEALLAKGAKVNVVDKNGDTPLHYAAICNRIDIVNALLSAGAKINTKDKDGKTPLHLAAQVYCLDLADILLKQKANPLLKDNDGKTPRNLAEDHITWLSLEGGEAQRWKEAEEEMRQYLKSVMITSVTVGCSTAAGGAGVVAVLTTAEYIPLEPKHMILMVVAIALVSLAVGYIVYQAFKEPSTKVDETQQWTKHNHL